MLITKNISAYNQICTFAQDNWGKVGWLVKYIIDNHKDTEFDLYMNTKFPNGVDEDEFKNFCCDNTDEILNALKGE